MADFEGVFPAIITPMNRDNGRLNEEAYRTVMEFNIQAGVHGFWIAGGSGESVLLDDKENMRIAEISSDQSGGRIKNIMHVGAATTEKAVSLAENAARVGIEAICCVPPFFYSQNAEAIVEHYRVVAMAADLPLFVYNLPSSTGVEITPELMLRIQDKVPQLKGLKHSSVGLFHNIRDFAHMGLECFVGHSVSMLPGMTIGAVGTVDGPPNAAPELYLDVWDAYNEGDIKRAEAAQDKASDVANMVYKYGFHATLKFLLSERLSIDCGEPRKPTPDLTSGQKSIIAAKARELGLDKVTLGSVKN